MGIFGLWNKLILVNLQGYNVNLTDNLIVCVHILAKLGIFIFFTKAKNYNGFYIFIVDKLPCETACVDLLALYSQTTFV